MSDDNGDGEKDNERREVKKGRTHSESDGLAGSPLCGSSGNAANTPLCKDGFLIVNEDIDFLRPFSIRHVISLIESSEVQIKDVRGLAVGAVPLVVLSFVKEGEGRRHLFEPEGQRI